ncbi:MAG: sodium/proline symporter PutP [Firmicutes bacterium]|nr:sodium/proline symporter PutP [Bacillota bacterium]
MTVNVWIITAFVLYLAIMIGIGVAFSKKSNNVSDYFLGGRKMGSWLTALSAQASDMSSWLLMGLPGAVYLSGISSAWIAIGLAIGTYLNWLLVAKRLRSYSQAAGDAITIPQYFQNRFDSNSKAIRIVCAVIIFIFFLIYTASGFNAAAKLVENVFGIRYTIGLTIGAVVILTYTFMGGYFAVVWTDFFQGMLMFAALLIVPIIAYAAIGSESFESITAAKVGYMSLMSNGDQPYSVTDILSNLAWGLGYFGMPHILVRFMSIKSTDLIKKSRIIAMVWVIISLAASVAVGCIGYVYLEKMGAAPLNEISAETIFMVLVQKLTPGLIAGILLCAIVSAIMSTSDSQLLVTASAVTNDIYAITAKNKPDDKKLLMLSRIAIAVVAIIAYVIALNPENTVMALVANAWAGFGAAFGPAMLLSLFWRRMTMKGALAGMISGAAAVMIWNKFLTASTGIYELLPAFFISLVLIVIVSLIDKEPNQKVLEQFDKVAAMK